MESKNQLFSIIEPSKNLKISIMNKIRKEEIKKTIYKIAFSSILSLGSVAMSIIFIMNVIKDTYQSGLYEYLSLIASDGALVISYWKTFTMSVVESLPILQITMVFTSVWIFVWSINMVLTSLKNTKSIFYKIN